jgi:hypothetical protein
MQAAFPGVLTSNNIEKSKIIHNQSRLSGYYDVESKQSEKSNQSVDRNAQNFNPPRNTPPLSQPSLSRHVSTPYPSISEAQNLTKLVVSMSRANLNDSTTAADSTQNQHFDPLSREGMINRVRNRTDTNSSYGGQNDSNLVRNSHSRISFSGYVHNQSHLSGIMQPTPRASFHGRNFIKNRQVFNFGGNIHQNNNQDDSFNQGRKNSSQNTQEMPQIAPYSHQNYQSNRTDQFQPSFQLQKPRHNNPNDTTNNPQTPRNRSNLRIALPSTDSTVGSMVSPGYLADINPNNPQTPNARGRFNRNYSNFGGNMSNYNLGDISNVNQNKTYVGNNLYPQSISHGASLTSPIIAPNDFGSNSSQNSLPSVNPNNKPANLNRLRANSLKDSHSRQ